MDRGRSHILVSGLWKVFGQVLERAFTAEWRERSKQEIPGQTGCVIALQDVSFSVREGESFGVMGLSGSGKSTLGTLLNPPH
jgi:glycine betaine/proline transport system ATP-binding protein